MAIGNIEKIIFNVDDEWFDDDDETGNGHSMKSIPRIYIDKTRRICCDDYGVRLLLLNYREIFQFLFSSI